MPYSKDAIERLVALEEFKVKKSVKAKLAEEEKNDTQTEFEVN